MHLERVTPPPVPSSVPRLRYSSKGHPRRSLNDRPMCAREFAGAGTPLPQWDGMRGATEVPLLSTHGGHLKFVGAADAGLPGGARLADGAVVVIAGDVRPVLVPDVGACAKAHPKAV